MLTPLHSPAPAPSPSPRYVALIPAAGNGSRMGVALPKQYLELAGRPMLYHVLDTFGDTPAIAHIFVVVAADDAMIGPLLTDAPHLQEQVSLLRVGGATRQESVLNGLLALEGNLNESDWILVHDAARPGLSPAMIDRLIAAVGDDAVGGLLAMPIADTLKRGHQGRAAETVDRNGLWAAQTPQMFRFGLLLKALRCAPAVTDEAGAIEAFGHYPILVEGSTRNFKVTLPDDAALATTMLKGFT